MAKEQLGMAFLVLCIGAFILFMAAPNSEYEEWTVVRVLVGIVPAVACFSIWAVAVAIFIFGGAPC